MPTTRRRPAPGRPTPSSARDLRPRWTDRLTSRVRDRRRGGRRARGVRRVTAVALLLGAAALALTGPRPVAPGVPVVTVSRDLPAGAVLVAADLRVTRALTAPAGAYVDPAAAQGLSLTAGVRQGEIVTDARVVSATGPDPGPGRVAVPIRVTDAATADLLLPGTHLTVLRIDESGATSRVAADAVVLATPAATATGSGVGTPAATGRLVVLSVPAREADPLAAASALGDIAVRFA